MHRAGDRSGKLIGSCVYLLSTSRSLSTLIILLHRRMKKLWPAEEEFAGPNAD